MLQYYRGDKMIEKEKFLNLFVELEKALKDELNDTSLTFSQSLLAMKNKKGNNIIKQYRDEIDVIRSMRNIFAHERGGKTFELLLPTPRAITMLEHIVHSLKHPMTIAQFANLQNKTTYWYTDNHSLKDVLNTIQRKGIDKFPIFSNKQLVNVLTRTGIVNWLASVRDQMINFEHIKIKDVLPFEYKEPYQMMSSTTKLFRVLDAFEQVNSPKLILVSKREDGQISEPNDVSTVITAADLPKIMLVLSEK